MSGFVDIAFSYPTAIPSVLLIVVVFYWVLAMFGLVDFDSTDLDIDIDTDAQLDGDAGDIGALASYVVAMGLNGVPFSVVVSLLVLLIWMLTALFAEWILPLVPTAVLQVVVGTAALLMALAVSIIITAQIVRPMRKLFVSHAATSNASIVGQICKVVTQTVDERFGRAEVSTNGTAINIRVWATTPNSLSRGAAARILEYDPQTSRYLIVAES